MITYGIEPEFANLLKTSGSDSQPGGPLRQLYLTYRPPGYTQGGEIDSWLLKRLQVRALVLAEQGRWRETKFFSSSARVGGMSRKAEFLNVIGIKVLRVFLLAIHSHIY
jgi:hypothetical protein